MISTFRLINISIIVSGLTISVLGLALILKVQYMTRQQKYFFFTLFSLSMAYNLTSLVAQLSLSLAENGNLLLSKTAMFLQAFFSSVIMPLLTIYILLVCKESIKCHLMYLITGLWIIYFLLLVITQHTTFIYYFSHDNTYHRGPYYPLLLLPAVLIMLVNLIVLQKRKHKMSSATYKAFLVYLLLPMAAMLIQMFTFGIQLIVFATSLAALILFLYTLSQAAQNTIRQKAALAEQKYLIKSMQIPQHFIYNTLTNIYYLCDIDAKKAQSLVDSFTTYLKKNFSSIDKNGSISFADELEHTKAYLEVVKARYEDLLFVEYNIANSSFNIPPLTLEPIVENAVKHALDPDLGPLHIRISTRKENHSNIIVVENSGKDFKYRSAASQYADEAGTHVGLENIKSRLDALCNGQLIIEKRAEGGTKVTIKIPQK